MDNNQLVQTYIDNGIYEYKNNQFITYLLNSSEYDTTQYLLDNKVYTRYNLTDEIRCETYNEYNSGTVTVFNSLFLEDAFKYVYTNDVEKIINESGYTLNLDADFKGYMYLTSIGHISYEQFEQLWVQYDAWIKSLPQDVQNAFYFNVTINFNDNDEIIDIIINMSQGTYESDTNSSYQDVYVVTITKTTLIVEEPQWVRDYIESQN